MGTQPVLFIEWSSKCLFVVYVYEECMWVMMREGTREDFPKPGTVDPLEKDELETGTSQ